MRRKLVLALSLALALVLETTVFNGLQIFGVEPDVVLILVVAFSMLNEPNKGAIFGFIGGLMQDILIGRYIGMNALTKAITCYLIGQVERKIYKEHLMVPFAIVALATLINEFLFYLISFLVGLDLGIVDALHDLIIPMIIYNGLLAPIVYHLFYRSSTKGWLRSQDYRDW